jgi:GNAT superfamily N-acetyltransferase
MQTHLTIERLSQHLTSLPLLAQWFEAEWPAWYGSGDSGDAERDLQVFAAELGLPTGFIALHDGVPCGVAALKAHSIASHVHCSPWAAAGYVLPALRGQGIGQRLLSALVTEASVHGFERIYCASATAESLLLRAQWQLLERVQHDGQSLGIYAKNLPPKVSNEL